MHEKSYDYTSDIRKQLELHHETLTKKVAHLLALTRHQYPDVRAEIIRTVIKTEFGFMFSKSKKAFTEDFKETLRSVLIESLTHNYDRTQAEKHIFGYAIKTIPESEFQTLRVNYALSPLHNTAPKRESTPQLFEFINKTLEIQNKVCNIPNYITINEADIANYSVLISCFYNNRAKKTKFVLPLVFSISILLLTEALTILSYYFSADHRDNEKVLPLVLTSIFINAITYIAMISILKQLEKNRVMAKSGALNTVNDSLSTMIPSLITHKVVVEGKTTYSYELPIFTNPLAPVKNELPETSVQPIDSNLKQKTKSRPSHSIRMFKPTQKSISMQSDTLIIDEISYQRLYNKDGKPTPHFIGYTDESLNSLTTPANRETFKSLLDRPRIVPPKDNQGIVFMKTNKHGQALAPFKLKSHGDDRLLFKHVSDETHNNESIKLYQLSGSKTHNQMSRMKHKK